MAYVNDLRGLGQRIHQLRTERKISQSEIATLIDRDILDIQLLEIGICDLELGELFELLAGLGISFRELLTK